MKKDSKSEIRSGSNEEGNRRATMSRYTGCLLGGAVGDALGAPVEFMPLEQISLAFGPEGLTDYAMAYGRPGAVTDDTQMTIFTAEGLLRAYCRLVRRGITHAASVTHHAYLRWLNTQGVKSSHEGFNFATRKEKNGWVHKIEELYSQRGPGNTCLSALQSSRMGTMDQPLNNSKGCGGVMRAPPAGLFLKDPEKAFELGCEIAAITHGHPSGYLSAGALAAIISGVVSGGELEGALESALDMLRKKPDSGECVSALTTAVEKASNVKPSPRAVESLGGGWVGEEALAIAVYCSLAGGGDFGRSVLLAVNHGGDSDSTGAITGNIIGALKGKESIPERWLKVLELRPEIEALAKDLFEGYRDGEEWWKRYPGC